MYGGAVLTALKRSADMSVEEAIQYKVSTCCCLAIMCDEMSV